MQSSRNCRGKWTHIGTVIGAVVALTALTSCGGSGSEDSASEDDDIILAAPADTDALPAALPESEVAAIVALGETGAGRPPAEDGHHHHGGSHSAAEVSAADQPQLDAEIALARSVLDTFDTVEKAAARGYVLATSPSPGIGTHWVRWSQIPEPFTPGNPSMLLFDHTRSPPVLVGYSYAVQSKREPLGFTGKSDEWHRHAGLCVALTGWVIRERSTGPDACEGSYIAGGDFWMLHAWVVPGWENADGMFAPANPKLCPPKTGPDFLLCAD